MHSICLSVFQKTFKMRQSQNDNNTDKGKSRDNSILTIFAENVIVKSRIALFHIRFATEIQPRRNVHKKSYAILMQYPAKNVKHSFGT